MMRSSTVDFRRRPSKASREAAIEKLFTAVYTTLAKVRVGSHSLPCPPLWQ
jgi:hypothetical protein